MYGRRRVVRHEAERGRKPHALLWVCAAALAAAACFLCVKLLAKPLPASARLPTMTKAAETPAQPTAPAPTTAPPSASPSPSPTAPPAASPPKKAENETQPPQPEIGQLVVVTAKGSRAEVSLYELEGGKWSLRLKTEGCVGKAGLADAADKREGDNKTPKGLYGLSFAFGIKKPETKMDFRLITKNSYWVDDPESPYYNTWQEGKKGWKSAEDLYARGESYRYAVATGYNAQCRAGRGSAIFLHCRTRDYTSGCIAVPEEAMLRILAILDPKKNPHILIEDGAAAVNAHGLVTVS